MFSWFSWIFAHWTVLIWAVPGLLVIVVGTHFLGRWFSVPASVVIIALITFLLGKKMERDIYKNRARDIHQKREQAYEKIDSRDTDTGDVLDRLQRGDY